MKKEEKRKTFSFLSLSSAQQPVKKPSKSFVERNPKNYLKV